MTVAGTTFIRDTFKGAFCLFESMATFLPVVDTLTVLDLGSSDRTWETLLEIAHVNSKIVAIQKEGFSKVDASAFADAANWCIKAAQCGDDDLVLFWQADEILHQNMLSCLVDALKEGKPRSMWRYQLRENFQRIKWFPHIVHRIGKKGSFEFVGDGMNTEGYFGVPLLGDYDGGWFTRWGAEFEKVPETLPTHQMMLDVSMVGAFRDNIPDRRRMHASFWHEQPNIEGQPAYVWLSEQRQNPNWTKKATPFNIPHIMRWHLGRTKYSLRYSLYEALKNDETEVLLFP